MANASNALVRLRLLGAASFAGEAKKAERSLKGLSDEASHLGGALGTAATAAGALAAGGLFYAVKSSTEFEQKMANVQSRLLTTGANMTKLSNLALKLGSTTSFSATQAADGMDQLAAAGFSTREIMKTLPGTISLAAASGTDLAAAAELQGAALRGFQLDAGKAGHVADVLALTVNKSALEMSDLAETLPYVASTAKQTGTSFEQVAAAAGILGNAGIKGCYDRETDVLTRDGFKPWEDVTEHDEFATLNPSSNAIEYQHPSRVIRYQHTGPMYKVRNKHVDLLVTPDHRMWVRRRDHDAFEVRRAHDLPGKTVEYQTGEMEWAGVAPDVFVLPGFSQPRGFWTKEVAATEVPAALWAEFLGYYISEGCAEGARGDYRVQISQRKGASKATMRACLERMPFHFREHDNGFVCHSQQLSDRLRPLGHSHEKHVPDDIKLWSPDLLRVLMEAMRLGDGDSNGNLYTCSPRLRDDIQELALKCGWATSYVHDREPGDFTELRDGRTITARRVTYKVRIAKRQLTPCHNPGMGPVHRARNTGRTPVEDGWVDFDDEVFCAEVPNGLLIVRRGGRVVVSGNSMAGTALRTSMLRLTDPTRKMKENLSDLGIGARDLAAMPLPKVIAEVAEGLKRLPSRGEKVGAISAIFGKEAAPAMLNLMAQGSKGINKFTRALENSRGAAKRMADIQRNTVKGAFDNLTGAIETAAIKLTQRFNPALKKALNQGAGQINKLTALADGFQKGFSDPGSAGKKTVQFGSYKAAPIEKGPGSLAKSSPAELLGAKARKGAEKALKFLTGTLVPGIKKVAGEVMAALKPAKPFLDNIILPLLKGFGKGVLGTVKALFEIFKVVTPLLGKVGTAAKPLSGVFEKIGAVLGFVFGPGVVLKVLKFAKGLPFLGVAIRAVSLPFRALGVAGRFAFRQIVLMARILRFLARPILAVGRYITGVARTWALHAGGMRAAIVQFADNVANRVGTVIRTIRGIVRAIRTAVTGVKNALGGGVKEIAAAALSLGTAIISGIVKGISSAAGALGKVLTSTLNSAKKYLGLDYTINGTGTVTDRGALGGAKPAVVPKDGFARSKKASGGWVANAGPTWVGERGPEILNLRSGSHVTDAPMSRMAYRRGNTQQITSARPQRAVIVIDNKLHVAGKQLHRSVFEVERELEYQS